MGNAIFYYNGLILVLRGGDEHRNLKLSQFKIKTVPHPQFPSQETECLVYTEHGSKNYPGDSKQLNLDNRVITQYAKPHLGDRCHIQLLKKYFSKLPQTALEKDFFYWRPKRCLVSGLLPEGPWYVYVFKSKLKEMFKIAGLSIHNLRATGISRLYSARVPEKLIMERSGHLSKEGLRGYEQTSAQQEEKAVSDLLTSSASCYSESLQNQG